MNFITTLNTIPVASTLHTIYLIHFMIYDPVSYLQHQKSNQQNHISEYHHRKFVKFIDINEGYTEFFLNVYKLFQ